MLSQLPVNIWMVTHLMYRKLGTGERALIVSLILNQLYLSFSARNVLLNLTIALHSSAKNLGLAQTVLKVEDGPQNGVLNYSATVRAKLKLSAYYEMVHSDQKFYFTLGPLGNLSQRSILEVRIVFVVLVIF